MIETHALAQYNDERRTTLLYGKKGPIGEFFIRGGISWPTAVPFEDSFITQGYAILGAYDVKKKTLHIVEQIEFKTVEPVLAPKGVETANGLIEEGISAWLNNNWSRWYAGTYYWEGGTGQYPYTPYLIDIFDAQSAKRIQPNIGFIQVHWADEYEAQDLIWKHIMLRSDLGVPNTLLHKQIKILRPDNDEHLSAVHALQCLLAGMHRYPWRELKDD